MASSMDGAHRMVSPLALRRDCVARPGSGTVVAQLPAQPLCQSTRSSAGIPARASDPQETFSLQNAAHQVRVQSAGRSGRRLAAAAPHGHLRGQVRGKLHRTTRRAPTPHGSPGRQVAHSGRAGGVAWPLASALCLVRPAIERDLYVLVTVTGHLKKARPSMKIAHVLTRGDVLGGAQTHVRELSLELRRLGHDVTVITGAPGIFTDQLREAGIPWLQVRSLVRPLRPHRDLAALVQLWSVLRQLKPDLVCAHTAKAGSLGRAAAWLHNIPSVFTPHGWSMFDRTSLQWNPLFCWGECLAGRLTTRVINVCEFERQFAQQLRVCPANKLEVVHNGIAEIPSARVNPVDTQPPLIVMVARFASQKDHATL